MKVFAFGQYYNEEMFVGAHLEWIYPLADHILFTEGNLSPFGNLPKHSQDMTQEIIKEQLAKDKLGKMHLVPTEWSRFRTREIHEGFNKNTLLKKALDLGLSDGDIIYIMDSDEFFEPSAWLAIRDILEKNPKINKIKNTEYQFAYNTKLQFKSDHPRWYRYQRGAKFSTNNNLLINGSHKYVPDITLDREEFPYYHFTWLRDPELIRNKVISFARPSLTAWFNNVYLEWPRNNDLAYRKNSCIPPYYGKGFAEGHPEKLLPFEGVLPDFLRYLEGYDFLTYTEENRERLLV